MKKVISSGQRLPLLTVELSCYLIIKNKIITSGQKVIIFGGQIELEFDLQQKAHHFRSKGHHFLSNVMTSRCKTLVHNYHVVAFLFLNVLLKP